MPDVTISGLGLTSRILREQGEDIAYIALSEITDRSRAVGAARVDFSAVGLGPWLKRPSGDDDDDPGDEEEPGDEGDEEEPDLRDALAEGIVDTRLLAIAGIRWIEETVTALMAGRTHGKFKVGLWSPGGKTLIHSSRFEAENPHARRRPADEEAEMEAERAALPVAPKPDLAPTVHAPVPRPGPAVPEERVWQALGDGYTQLISLTQSTYSHIAKLQSAEIQSLSAQNKRLSDTLEAVSSDLRNVHIGTAEVQRDEVAEATAAKVREELGKQFIEQLGAGVRAYIASKAGMPPEVAEVADVLGSSPDLLEALKLPHVRAMLKEPAFVQELAETLKSIGAPAAAPQTPPPNPAPTDTSPTEGAPHAS
jgi:hypothetical protein